MIHKVTCLRNSDKKELPYQTPQFDEYVYQFQVKAVEEFLAFDYINILKITTKLAVMPDREIPLTLYATERVITKDYFPEKGQDIMGMFILSSSL